MVAERNTSQGTMSDTFQVGKRAAQLKKSSTSRMSVRNEADSALANMEGADPVLDQDFVTKIHFENNSVVGDLPTVQIRRSTTLAVTTSFADILFDTTDIENDAAVLEHDNTNIERISIKKDGLYKITYQCSVNADAGEEAINMRVLKNGAGSALPGSDRTISEDDEINDIGNIFYVELLDGDYITFQISAAGNGNVLNIDSTYTISRHRGSKGDKGDTGAGSSIDLETNDAAISGGPHDTINLIGNGVSGADAGSGQANVTILHAFNIGVGRNSANATNEWMRDANGTPMNLSPFRVPFACRIIAISATGNANQTWDAEIHTGATARVGGVPLDAAKLTEIQMAAANSNSVTSLAVDLAAGAEIGVFMRGTSIDWPRVSIWLERTG